MTNKTNQYEQMNLAHESYEQYTLHNDNAGYLDLKLQADNGNPWSIMKLAEINIEENKTLEGEIDPRSPGIKWLKSLAKQPFVPAAIKLAEIHLLLNQNQLALELLIECLEHKSADAAALLVELYHKNNPEISQYLQKKSRKWSRKFKPSNNPKNLPQSTLEEESDTAIYNDNMALSDIEMDDDLTNIRSLVKNKKKEKKDKQSKKKDNYDKNNDEIRRMEELRNNRIRSARERQLPKWFQKHVAAQSLNDKSLF